MQDKCETDTERKLAQLEERIVALDRLLEARIESARLMSAAADIKIDERFKSHNEWREQLRDREERYVTRDELRWLIGIVVGLVGAVVGLLAAVLGLFLKVPR